MPELYIITGSNGAGKSTIGPSYLPVHIQKKCKVFDGDKLFMNKQRELWKAGIKAHKEAKKLALSFVEETFDRLVETLLKPKATLFMKAISPMKQPGKYLKNLNTPGTKLI